MSNRTSSDFHSVKTAAPSTHPAGKQRVEHPSWLWAAVVSGIVGFLCFVSVPFLPVHQTQSSVSWPQHGSLNSIQTPLVSYAPVDFTAEIPLAGLSKLHEDQTMVLGTIAEDFVISYKKGFFVKTNTDGGFDVSSRGDILLTVDEDTLRTLPKDARISVHFTENLSTIEIPGGRDTTGQPLSVRIDDTDYRPDVTGVYTELADTSENFDALTQLGIHVHYTIDSRFTTSPTFIKTTATVLGVLCLLIAFLCLRRFDSLDGTHPQTRFRPGRWKLSGLDWIVTAILLFWHIFGGNTTDDGYILTMAREAQSSGYMANYYRWYGVTEAPFGFPLYNLFESMAKISTSSVWMRLPALICAFAAWFVISRSLLPKLGDRLHHSHTARWAAAVGFLLFWLPFNNGLRPEPFIAFGALLAWACFEQAIKDHRLSPAGLGLFVTTMTLGCGPTGLMAVAAFIVSLLPLLTIVREKVPVLLNSYSLTKTSRSLVVCALILPFLPIGTAILGGVFGDQTLSSVLESVRVRTIIGPNKPWYDELSRYDLLFGPGIGDGAFPRRFAVLSLFLYVFLVLLALNQYKKKSGVSRGVASRVLWIILLSLLFLTFTPTKWSHHFGIFAGLSGVIAALGLVSLHMLTARSVFKKCVATAGVLMIFAYSLAGNNGWWYISSWRVPWFDKAIQYHGHLLSNGVLYVAMLLLVGGAVYHVVHTLRKGDGHNSGKLIVSDRFPASAKVDSLVLSPVFLLSAITVFILIASMGKAFASQYPAYNVGLGNIRALTGNTCQLANDVLVEADTNNSFLTPIGTTLGKSLNVNKPTGFGPNNVPDDFDDSTGAVDEGLSSSLGDFNSNIGDSSDLQAQKADSSEQKDHSLGINGSSLELPFNLDSQKVPVLGSWSPTSQVKAHLESAWFELPDANDNQPLLVVSVAGKFEHLDADGVVQDGPDLALEYATRHDDGSLSNTGELSFYDIAKTSQWRNLRMELQAIPDSANVVRLSIEDLNLDQKQWIAVTPPRVPTLNPMNTVINKDDPALVDWLVGLQFPCQRPFGHYAGVAEAARYRITPGIVGKDPFSEVQAEVAGGVMGLVDTVGISSELPSYLNKDWHRDWGTIEIYKQRTNSQDVPPDTGDIEYQEMTRSGLWSTGHMKISGSEEERS